MTLSELAIGESAYVLSLHNGAAMRRRLSDIGLIEGTKIRCLGESPMADPRAYLVRSATIALRSEDAALIHITEPTTGGRP